VEKRRASETFGGGAQGSLEKDRLFIEVRWAEKRE